MSDEPAEFGLVMPFVACASNGGPYDDLAYCAGWEMGAIDLRLTTAKAAGSIIHSVTISADNGPQMDLLAMKHGLLVGARHEDDDAPGWITVELEWF